MIGWGPVEFREATIRDLFDGLDGWREAHGVKKPSGGMTRERLAELKAQYGD